MADAAKGGYVLEGDDDPEVILIATGSEVHLIQEARALLTEKGIRSRVVSLPSWELFEEQTQEYRDSVIPPGGDRPGDRRGGGHRSGGSATRGSRGR